MFLDLTPTMRLRLHSGPNASILLLVRGERPAVYVCESLEEGYAPEYELPNWLALVKQRTPYSQRKTDEEWLRANEEAPMRFHASAPVEVRHSALFNLRSPIENLHVLSWDDDKAELQLMFAHRLLAQYTAQNLGYNEHVSMALRFARVDG